MCLCSRLRPCCLLWARPLTAAPRAALGSHPATASLTIVAAGPQPEPGLRATSGARDNLRWGSDASCPRIAQTAVSIDTSRCWLSLAHTRERACAGGHARHNGARPPGVCSPGRSLNASSRAQAATRPRSTVRSRSMNSSKACRCRPARISAAVQAKVGTLLLPQRASSSRRVVPAPLPAIVQKYAT